MKLLGTSLRQGKRIAVQVEWSTYFFLEGPEPEPDTLITLDLPLESPGEDRALEESHGYSPVIQQYLQSLAQGTTESNRRKRQPVLIIPRRFWQKATLDDFMEAVNGKNFSWNLAAVFPLEAFAEFSRKYSPLAQERLQSAISTSDSTARLEVLQRDLDFLQRFGAVIGEIDSRFSQEITALLEEADRKLLAAIPQPTPQDYLVLLGQVRSDAVREEALMALAEQLASETTSQEQVLETLNQLRGNPGLFQLARWSYNFWRKLGRVVELPATENGITLDITEASETRVYLNWDLLEARRIGPIEPDRNALVVTGDNGEVYYIRGEHKLKFQVQRAPGGQLKKFGCTLTMLPDEGRVRLSRLLLDVERLDALAQLDPEAAIATVPAAASLPENHPVYQAAAQARQDHRQARILADLLIELHIGVDADRMRQLSRNRR